MPDICRAGTADRFRHARGEGPGGAVRYPLMTKGANPTIAFDSYILGAHARNHGIYVYAKELLGYFREMAPQYSVEIAPYVSPATEMAAIHLTPPREFVPRPPGLLERSRPGRGGGPALRTTPPAPSLGSAPPG